MGKHIKDGYLPTAKDFYYKHTTTGNDPGKNTLNLMIEFAKLHVEAAKKQFKIVINEIDDPFPFERKDILKDIYPLKNTK